MPRRASFAEVSRSVTKKTSVKSELRRRATTNQLGRLKRKESTVKGSTSISEDIQENETTPAIPKNQSETDTPNPDTPEPETAENEVKEEQATTESQPEGEDSSQIVVLSEEPVQEENPEQAEDEAEEEADKGEKQGEGEAARRVGRGKRLSKKQLRLLEEQKEEEQMREERRKRREERRRKKELQAQLAAQEAPQSFDEAAFKESIYTIVKSSLDLVMQGGELNITVDNLTPLMKGLELDTGDEDVKELILEALLNSYGIIEPKTLDELILKKQMQQNLQELEDCVDTAFAIIDQDRDGIITHNDVYRLMIRLGEVLWDEQVAAILQAADVDGDGRISKKDLFLFLLGREKSVKLEDQILNKYGDQGKPEENQESSPEDLKPANTAQKSVTAEEPKANPAAPEQDSEQSKDSSSPASSAATLQAAPPPEDSDAAKRRRKMFSGYSRMIMAANSLSSKSPDPAEEDGNKKEDNPVPPGGEDPEQNSSVSLDAKTDTEAKPCVGDNSVSEAETKAEIEDREREDADQGTQLSRVSVASDEWSDSGHVDCEGVSDRQGEESDTETEASCAPLSLDTGISFLPAPEFNTIPSRDSPRSPSVTSSPRWRIKDALLNDFRPESPLQAVVNTQRKDALLAFNYNLDRLVSSDPQQNVPDRTSEYDSEHEDDDDALPESSQQNLILKEIEEQVLHTKEALNAKAPCIPQRMRSERESEYMGDGCESVVESLIHPVYVPPCARDARSGLKLSSTRVGEVFGDASDVVARGSPVDRSKLYVPEMSRNECDILSVEECNTADILSKGYVSLTSPRSSTSVTFKLPLHDINDDASSFTDNVFDQDVLPEVSDRVAFDFKQPRHSREEQRPEKRFEMKINIDDEDNDDNNDNEVCTIQEQGELEDAGLEDNIPACDRARKMSKRRSSSRPLRRSLTCHVITVKDLSNSTSSPSRKDGVTRGPSLAQNSFSPSRRDHSHGRREVNTRLREASTDRREQRISVRETPERRRVSPLTLPESSPTRPWQSFSPARASSLTRTSSPASRGTACRFYSPTGRKLDSFRSLGLDSSRTSQDSYRSQKTSGHIARCQSARSVRDFPGRPREGWTTYRSPQRGSQRESSLGRSEASPGRSGGRSHRSVHDDADNTQTKKEPVRFYGPNFELIMSQKGEPKELLQESLLRDAVTRSSGRRFTNNEVAFSRENDSSPAPKENRRALVSQQLERVKQMEILIKQRRQNMESEEHGQQPAMRRSRTTNSLKSMDDDTESAEDLECAQAFLESKAGGGSGNRRRSRPRPRSCLSARTPAVVTLNDTTDLHTDIVETNTKQTSRNAESQPAVHVLDLSSLLSDVNEPEPSQEVTTNPAEKRHAPKFKPLARMLVAYERARLRQAANVNGSSKPAAATSISRQLQQGIPYRPPTPPQPSTNSCGEAVPRKVRSDKTDTYPNTTSTNPTTPNPHPQSRSFVLSSQADETFEKQFALFESMQQRTLYEPEGDLGDILRDGLALAGARHNKAPSVTFEFPERSVCVLKRHPVAVPSGNNS